MADATKLRKKYNNMSGLNAPPAPVTAKDTKESISKFHKTRAETRYKQRKATRSTMGAIWDTLSGKKNTIKLDEAARAAFRIQQLSKLKRKKGK